MKAGSQGSGGRTETRMKRKKYLVLKKYLSSDLLCGHGEQGGDAESHPGRHRLGVEPEVHLVKKFRLQQSWI